MNYSEILELPVYGIEKEKKQEMMLELLKELTFHHKINNEQYNRFLQATEYCSDEVKQVKDVPFLPVRMFKNMDLCSVEKEDIFKVMTSSGTTGQRVSKIYLDKETAANQQKTLSKIMQEYLGKSRIPMLIIDSPSVVKDRRMFSARGAGILGFSMFGSKKKYALDENMMLDVDGVKAFLQENENKTIFVFGFTYIIWQYFYKVLKEKNIHLPLEHGIMLHGGGWKKIQEESVSAEEFKKCLEQYIGIQKVHEYYGMVEQTGCIYVACEHGFLHASTFSDIIIRDAKDFSECEVGQEGLIQVLSMIPKSYPGHSILTEDKGVIWGEDTCPCGRKGKYFKVCGRIKNAEIRGCSDTFQK